MELYKKIKLNPFKDERGKLFNPIEQAELFLGNISNVHTFSCAPGAIRGNHYHEIRNEKFLVMKGEMLFVVKDPQTGEKQELKLSQEDDILIEIPPKVPHALKNIGDEDSLVLCYSNYKSKKLDKDPVREVVIAS